MKLETKSDKAPQQGQSYLPPPLRARLTPTDRPYGPQPRCLDCGNTPGSTSTKCWSTRHPGTQRFGTVWPPKLLPVSTIWNSHTRFYSQFTPHQPMKNSRCFHGPYSCHISQSRSRYLALLGHFSTDAVYENYIKPALNRRIHLSLNNPKQNWIHRISLLWLFSASFFLHFDSIYNEHSVNSTVFLFGY